MNGHFLGGFYSLIRAGAQNLAGLIRGGHDLYLYSVLALAREGLANFVTRAHIGD